MVVLGLDGALGKYDTGREAVGEEGLECAACRSASSLARFESARFRYDWKNEPVAAIHVLILTSALSMAMMAMFICSAVCI